VAAASEAAAVGAAVSAADGANPLFPFHFENFFKEGLQFPGKHDKINIYAGLHQKFYQSEEVFGLPNIKSAKKRVLVSEAKAARNKAARSALKTQLKKFEAVVGEGNRSEAEGVYKLTVKAVDQAAARGLLHQNNAAHKKSSMTLKLNRLAQ
jgi:small subunit ribosomal protein S20